MLDYEASTIENTSGLIDTLPLIPILVNGLAKFVNFEWVLIDELGFGFFRLSYCLLCLALSDSH